jgi:hypothetical protein
LRAALLGGWLVLAGHGTAQACAFDMVKPERTAIDWIVDADHLVLTRPQAGNAFLFGVEEVLAGRAEATPVDQLVDTATRNRLVLNPDDAVLFARIEGGPWHRVGYVDARFRDLMDVALAHRSEWRAGMTQSRTDFIHALQASDDPIQRTVVIGELDKVPYPDLRAFDLHIPVEQLLADLWTPAGYPYQAIRALLLGLSGTPEARAEIAAFIDRVEDWEWANNLGAFAAAYIELEGVAGVEHLARGMLSDAAQPLDKVEQIVMALSVHHGLAEPALRDAIGETIQKLVVQRPETGVAIARQFSLRADWSQSAVLEPLVRARNFTTMGDLLTVSVYLATARQETMSTGGTE